MNLFNFISQIFKPATDLIDNLHTSEDEKLTAKAALLQVQAEFLTKALDFERAQIEAKANIIQSEAKSESWLTRSWRPITMMGMLTCVIGYWFGWAGQDVPPEIIDQMFGLVKIGVGGYIGSRGIEKVVPGVVEALKVKDQT